MLQLALDFGQPIARQRLSLDQALQLGATISHDLLNSLPGRGFGLGNDVFSPRVRLGDDASRLGVCFVYDSLRLSFGL